MTGYDVELVTVPSRRIAALPDLVPSGDFDPDVAHAKLRELLRAKRIRSDGSFTIVFDRTTGGVKAVGCGVGQDFRNDPPVILTVTPHGTAARTRHVGSGTRLAEASAAIDAWCDDNGHSRATTCWAVAKTWRRDPDMREFDLFHLLPNVHTQEQVRLWQGL